MGNEPLTLDQAQAAVDALTAHDGNIARTARFLGMSRSTLQSRLQVAEKYGVEPGEGNSEALPSPLGPTLREHDGPRVYVVTAAQNATPVHSAFHASLRRYCKDRGATLVVIPFRYRNPTSVFPASQQNQEHWDAEIAEELIAEDVPLNDNLLLAAGMKIQPTAKRPLSGLQTYSEDKSAVFGHTKIELETVATPQNTLPKILTTTGAITEENYTDTKAGRLGEHHHVLGATVIEIEDDGVFHLRQINACDDGSFVDLDREYTPRSSRKAPRPLALTCADVHHAQMDPDVEASVFGEGGLVDELRPRHLVLHDLLDFHSQLHHHVNNFFEQFRKHRLGIDGVYDEVSATLDWTNKVSQRVDEVAVVESNHNEAFTRWLNDGRGDKDPKNAWFYHASWQGILPAPWEDSAEIGHPLEYWYHQWYGEGNVRFLKRNEPYVIGGVDHHMHGDVGTNGSKGSLTQFNKLGVRSTSGHNHGPGIHGGAHQVGVMQLKMRYNEHGPSNWLPTHSLLYHNGKRTLVTSVGKDYRARFPEALTPA